MNKNISVGGGADDQAAGLKALLKRGLMLHEQGRWPEAIEHWTWVCASHPAEPEPAAQLGFAWFGQGDVAQAERQFDLVRQRFDANPWGHFGMALLHEAQHQWVEAANALRKVTAITPDAASAHEHLAHCLARLDRPDEALVHLDIVLALNSGNATALEMKKHLVRPRKSDVINMLIAQFSLGNYLEYNKYTGELAFDAVTCAQKRLIFVPELQYQDPQAARRAALAAGRYSDFAFVAIEEIEAHVAAQRFDLIFFDPMHIRPDVDRALQLLPRLLKPGGFLIVHDCNPQEFELTSKTRRAGKWLGETYKAFALFHANNRKRSVTVNEDYGVGIILNEGLDLDYKIESAVEYESVAEDRPLHLGLIEWSEFQERMRAGDRRAIFELRSGASERGCNAS